MKKQLLCGVAVCALAAINPAMGADMPVKAPRVAAPVAPVYNWTGCYVGGNAGYSWGHARGDFNSATLGTSYSASLNPNGFIGGGQIGCNWQGGPNWVWGLETDFQGSAQKASRSRSDPFNGGEGTVSQTLEARLRWFGTVRARAGVLVTPAVLLYATGGFAYGNVKVTDTITATGTTATALLSTSKTRGGWTVGAGVEGAMGTWTNWTWKVEYLYIDLGTLSGSGLDPVGGVVSWNTRLTDNIVRVGVNYRFH